MKNDYLVSHSEWQWEKEGREREEEELDYRLLFPLKSFAQRQCLNSF